MTLLNQNKASVSPKNPLHVVVGKLLLNAWSAEFALRIKPLCNERDFLNSSLSWAFPQAYHAALFSARAVLAIDGIGIANPKKIEDRLNRWAHGGLYGPAFSEQQNPFADLMQQSLRGTPNPPPMNGVEAAALLICLTEKVHTVATIHEAYILNRMGADAYQQLVNELPVHLKNGFIGVRTRFLLSNNQHQ